jgi:hypothetical protein
VALDKDAPARIDGGRAEGGRGPSGESSGGTPRFGGGRGFDPRSRNYSLFVGVPARTIGAWHEAGVFGGRRSGAELRGIGARILYDFEVECREQGWRDPAFVYDEEHDLSRFTDGRFAFSREHADWGLLRKRGRMKGWAH